MPAQGIAIEGFYLHRLVTLGHRGFGIDFGPASIEYANRNNPDRSRFIPRGRLRDRGQPNLCPALLAALDAADEHPHQLFGFRVGKRPNPGSQVVHEGL